MCQSLSSNFSFRVRCCVKISNGQTAGDLLLFKVSYLLISMLCIYNVKSDERSNFAARDDNDVIE